MIEQKIFELLKAFPDRLGQICYRLNATQSHRVSVEETQKVLDLMVEKGQASLTDGVYSANTKNGRGGSQDKKAIVSSPTRPLSVETNADAIPSELKARPQWVGWRWEQRGGKLTKPPVQATGSYAKSSDSTTWSSFDSIYQAHRGDRAGRLHGVGYVFTEGDPFCGIDLDDCRDPDTGKLAAWAKEIIENMDSYAEVSPSGTGVKIIVKAKIKQSYKQAIRLPDGTNADIEIYTAARYFTLTGHAAHRPGEIIENQGAVDRLVNRIEAFIAETKKQNDEAKRKPATPSPPSPHSVRTLGEAEILERIRQSKQAAKFNRLWAGDTSEHNSQSEADFALCSMFAFWTGKDAAKMDNLFRQSGLFRAKWDEKHRRDGATYGHMTIEKAIRECRDIYNPKQTRADHTPKRRPQRHKGRYYEREPRYTHSNRYTRRTR